MNNITEEVVIEILKEQNELSKGDVLRIKSRVANIVDCAMGARVYRNRDSANLDILGVILRNLSEDGFAVDLEENDPQVKSYIPDAKTEVIPRTRWGIYRGLLNRRNGRFVSKEGD